MSQFFLQIFNTAITAGWLVLAVLVARLLLKKAPAWIKCALWAIVGLRLIWPFEIESPVSLVPSTQTLPPAALTAPTPQLHTGFHALNSTINPEFVQTFQPQPTASATPLQVATTVAAWIWIAGIIAMLAYMAYSYLRLRHLVVARMPVGEGIYLCDRVESPFILGIIRPKIYLPSHLSQEKWADILAHEQAHLNRRDHWWKPLGFLLLTVFWFHPLLWLAYVLLCRDVELACDEKVIRGLTPEEKQKYSRTLLECSLPRKWITACPLAFGEVGVKERVKNVLNFKKPGFWISVVAILAAVFVAVFLLTSPGMTEEEIQENLYQQLEQLQAADDVHFEISIKMAGEYDYYIGQEQEFWKHGDDWYRVMAFETKEGTYWEHYLQVGDTQHVSRDSEQIPRLESLDWHLMPEEYHLELYPLLTRNWREAKILEIREDGGMYTVLIQGDLEEDSKTTYYEHTHAFRLDENYQLISLTEYSKSDRYMEGHDGTSGRFDMEAWSEVRFLKADAAENAAMISEVMEELSASREFTIFLGTATIVEEDKEFDVSLGTVTVTEPEE